MRCSTCTFNNSNGRFGSLLICEICGSELTMEQKTEDNSDEQKKDE